MTRILIVEDRESLRKMLEDFLSERYYVFSAESAESAEKHLVHYPDIVLCDLRLPGKSGIDFIEIVKEKCPESEIVIMTAFGDIPTAVEAMKKGAFDFIPKPLDLNLLSVLLEKVEETISLKRKVETGKSSLSLIGESVVFKNTLALAKKYAENDFPVLILGESGTGKELLAKYVHLNSPRKNKNFVAVNSSAIPGNLFESELFGYAKGAFTGAVDSKRGLVELAEGGTLFFDEIGDLPLPLQAKILRLVENGEYQRIGGESFLKTDVRFIFATNKNLEEMVKKGMFREDLFHRMASFSITIPPLRERPEDIPLLAGYFMKKISDEMNLTPLKFDEEIMENLKKREWKGNVRELKNLVEKWIILGKAVFEDNCLSMDSERIDIQVVPDREFKDYVEEFEKKLLVFYLKKHNGNRLAVARELNMNYKTLLSKLARYGL